MEILEAYCFELDRVVDIYDAQDAFFALPESRRKRFKFGCSDGACRAEKNPLVSGVNYDKLSEETEKYRQLHFRAPAGHPHLDTCVWVQGHAQRHSKDCDADINHDARVERAKSTNVIDIFNPRAFDTVIDTPAGNPSATGLGAGHSPTSTDTSGGSVHARDGYSTTSRLERFIDCWAQFEGEDLKRHQVVIDGRTLSYRQAVLRPNWITPEEITGRIAYGGARIKFWPDDKPSRIYINFMDECEKLPEHGGGRSLTIDLPLARIRAYRGGALLLRRIEHAQKPGHYLKVYCWGSIRPRDQRPGYAVEIASLDNLVVKAIDKGIGS
ncbi:hypothetical protein Q3O93_02645 [Ralstonia pseudosolanacearum]|uniref:hypothetical protein n=1 Tax=Ralstonia pseudosolanacearum TaxID=1310165 RepID=UPI002676A2D7|nr:hypothetical protein [Ralstonia pseudosolanacearum]MDO3530813.1 hypothetical protein [Ralstonia pseudosolanacearum]